VSLINSLDTFAWRRHC